MTEDSRAGAATDATGGAVGAPEPPKKKVPLLERIGLKRSAEEVAAAKAAKEKAAREKAENAAAEKAAADKAAAEKAAADKAAGDKAAADKMTAQKNAEDRAATERAAAAPGTSAVVAPAEPSAKSGTAPGQAGAASSTTAPAVAATSPWARPTARAAAAGAVAGAAGAAASEGSILPGPYKANVSASGSSTSSVSSASSASSATEAKPLYRSEPSDRAEAKTEVPQSRFPRPVTPAAEPAEKTVDGKPEETAGPSTAVLPVVPAAPAAPRPADSAKPKAGVARRTRKARLRLSRLDPWSVMKTSFLFSIAAGIMLVVAVYVVWTVLSTSGLFDSVNEIVASVVSTPGDTTPFRIEEYINTQKVMGISALIACVDVVIFTALATLGSFLYNLAATMLGGLEITLAED